MPQSRLDDLHVETGGDQQRSEVVAQVMESEALRQPHLLTSRADRALDTRLVHDGPERDAPLDGSVDVLDAESVACAEQTGRARGHSSSARVRPLPTLTASASR